MPILAPDITELFERFMVVVDDNGDTAIYDALTGRYAPFHGDSAMSVSRELNDGFDDHNRYAWKDHL